MLRILRRSSHGSNLRFPTGPSQCLCRSSRQCPHRCPAAVRGVRVPPAQGGGAVDGTWLPVRTVRFGSSPASTRNGRLKRVEMALFIVLLGLVRGASAAANASEPHRRLQGTAFQPCNWAACTCGGHDLSHMKGRVLRTQGACFDSQQMNCEYSFSVCEELPLSYFAPKCGMYLASRPSSLSHPNDVLYLPCALPSDLTFLSLYACAPPLRFVARSSGMRLSEMGVAGPPDRRHHQSRPR